MSWKNLTCLNSKNLLDDEISEQARTCGGSPYDTFAALLRVVIKFTREKMESMCDKI